MTKTLWKDLVRSVAQSKGRFISLFLLMALGSFTLIGLKVTGPNMEKSANRFLDDNQVMDLTLLASRGFNQEDKTELANLSNAELEYAYQLDANFGQREDAIRLFSTQKKHSLSPLLKGHYPKEQDEIALAPWLEKITQLVKTLRLKQENKSFYKAKSLGLWGILTPLNSGQKTT